MAARPPDAVLVVGRACLDLVFGPLSAPPAPGAEVHAASALLAPGSVASVAIALARWGLAARLACPLADDPPGRYFADQVGREGVTLVPAGSGPATVSCGFPWEGDRALLTHAGSVTWDEARLLAELAETPRWLHLHAATPSATRLLIEARARGVTTSVKVSSDPAFLQGGPCREVLAQAQWAFLNGREAALLCGSADPVAVARWQERHLPHTTLVVTLGPQGGYWSGPAGRGRAAGVPVEALETTGAGDVYAAAAIRGLAAGLPAPECLRQAHRAAALSTRAPGALGALPPLAEWWRPLAAQPVPGKDDRS